MDSHELHEGMDACRSPSDLESSEFAPLAERLQADPAARKLLNRVQRFDGRIRAALHDVPVPAGSADRLLAKLLVDQQAAEEAVSPAADVIPAAAPARQSSRRLRISLALAASLLAAATLWLVSPGGEGAALTAANLAEQAQTWHSAAGDPEAWQDLADRPGAPFFPLDRRVRLAPRSWRDASDVVGSPAVAYDLTQPGGPRATLFVIDRVLAGLDYKPPHAPTLVTMGQAVAFWQNEQTLCVLVIEDETRYREIVDTSEPLVG